MVGWSPTVEITDGSPIACKAYEGGEWGRARHGRFMLCRISRLTLERTGVRVGRLQDISVEDSMAEGIKALSKDGGLTFKHGIPDSDGLPGTDDFGQHRSEWKRSARAAYHSLWESLHGPGSWDANPRIWVLKFRGQQAN